MPEAYPFAEFPWQTQLPDPRTHRLCAPAAGDDVRIDCAVEGASFIEQAALPQDEITVLAYNVERGFRVDEQLRALRDDAAIPTPDVILLSEADRGCSRTEYRNTAADYARALGMCYVFGTEFVELPRRGGHGGRIEAPCEHGNAILSRYPLGNVRLIRHESNRSWRRSIIPILNIGEPRLGGRVALAADVKVGEHLLRVYSVHFESGRGHDDHRLAQARELMDDAGGLPFPALIAGDMNVSAYRDDLRGGARDEPVTQAFFQREWVDAHAALPPSERITTESGVVIDLIMGHGVAWTDAGVGAPAVWRGLSDHLPVWAKLRLS
jgi:endonuclease/exonuclease/phosphatase family metal-dependent hydrolase